MAKCRFCGEQVAWFSNEHGECAEQHSRSLLEVSQLIRGHLDTKQPARELYDRAVTAARRGHMTVGELRNAAVNAIEHLATYASADHPATQADADRIKSAAKAFRLELNECGSSGIMLSKSAVSRARGYSPAKLLEIKRHVSY